MQNSFHRHINLSIRTDRIEVDLEDNFHRFSIVVGIEEGIVREITGSAPRTPWSTCATPLTRLSRYLGHSLQAPFVPHDTEQQCTHQIDMLRLAMSHARLGLGSRLYRIEITGDGVEETGHLNAGKAGHWCWQVRDGSLLSPGKVAGRSLADLHKWATDVFSEDECISAHMLRRAFHIGRGRFIDQDAWKTATDLGALPSCHTFQPDVAPTAIRIVGSGRDFTRQPNLLLEDITKPV